MLFPCVLRVLRGLRFLRLRAHRPPQPRAQQHRQKNHHNRGYLQLVHAFTSCLEARAALEPPNTVSVGPVGEADQLAALLEFERIATCITDVSPIVVPGLLQTADYARAIMSAGIPNGETDKRVMMRLGRRDLIIRRRSPVRFAAFMLEAALHQSIGGPDVMAEQLQFLLEMGDRNNVEIHVIPQFAGWTPAHAGPFVLLEFAKAAPVVHLEHHRSSAFLRDEGDVRAFVTAREDIERVAMSPTESLELIAGVINREETTT